VHCGHIWIGIRGPIVVPKSIKVGATVLWQATKTNNAADVSKIAGVKFAPSALDQLKQTNKSLSAFRSSLDPSVDVVHQVPFSIDIGEQKVVYRMYSRTSGSKFYEVHILGKESTPTIAGIRELEPNQVINLIAKPKIISLPQE
jgi:hypothetical protein